MQRRFTKFFSISFVLFSIHASAQYDPYFTHYMVNKLAYNPAVAGEKDAICANAITHQQWLGQKDQSQQYRDTPGEAAKGVNPATSGFSVTAPILKDNRMGVGLQVLTDKLGYNTALYFRGSLAYKQGFGRKLSSGNAPADYEQVIAFGADFGMAQIGMDGSKYNAVTPGDPFVPTSTVKGSKFDMGAGIYYTHQTLFDGAYAGLSMVHLTKPVIDVTAAINFTVSRYLYLVAGVRKNFGSIALLPSILVKNSPGSGIQVDLTARAEFNQKLVGGVNVRTGDGIALLFGYYIKPQFYFGYSYDITAFSKVNTYVKTGTHELFLSYCFDLTPPPEKTPRPRYNVRYIEGYTY